MSPKSLMLVCFALLWASGVSAQTDDSYSVRPGDRITIQLFTAAGQEVGVVGGQRTIDRDGNVFLPYVGTVQLSGLDQPGIRSLLADRYGEFYSDPVLDLKVELKISVTGAVPRTGQFYLDPTATLAEALAVAGGATPEFAVSGSYLPSDATQVRLVRGGTTTILNFRAEDVTQETLDMLIKSGDWIHVPYQPRSGVRDEILFWGSVVSLLASTAALIILLGG